VKHLGDLLFPFVVTLVSRSIPFDPYQHLVSIWGTDKQIGDALVVLGKQIVCKHVSAPKKKKRGTAPSGPVNTAPGPLPSAAFPEPSAPRIRPPPHQTTTLTQGRAYPSVASQPRALQPSLPPLTPWSRTMVMVSPSQSRDWSATPVVPSVRMASPDPTPDTLTSMDVDCIMTITGRQNSD